MGKLFTRSGEESVKECGKCNTVWKESYNDFRYDNECPWCYAEWLESERVKLRKIKTKAQSSDVKEKLEELDAYIDLLIQAEKDNGTL